MGGWTRRKLMATAGAAGGFAATHGALGLLGAGGSAATMLDAICRSGQAFAQDAGGEDYVPDHGDQPLRVRASATSQAGRQALDVFGEGVRRLHELAPDDPRHWRNLARIHDQHCPHGNWYFLPWHRAYLYSVEEVIRNIAEAPDFALPYWDWTADQTIPDAFWGAGSPLNPATWNNDDVYLGEAPTRFVIANESVPAEAVSQTVIDQIMGETDFEAFASYEASSPRPQTGPGDEPEGGQGGFEAGPHNIVHGFVGGHMSGFLSPLDPLFYAHHCNVDRIWAEWNAAGNANTQAPGWLNFRFANQFVTGAGDNIARFSIFSMLDPHALGYRYDTVPFAPAPSRKPAPVVATAPHRSVRQRVIAQSLAAQPLTAAVGGVGEARLALEPRLAQGLTTVAGAASASGRPGDRILADLWDFQLPENPASALIRLFVSRDGLNAATPITDPNYVASFGLFGHAHSRAHQTRQAVTIDLTPTLQRMQFSSGDADGSRTGARPEGQDPARTDPARTDPARTNTAQTGGDVDGLNAIISADDDAFDSLMSGTAPPDRQGTAPARQPAAPDVPSELRLQMVVLSQHDGPQARAAGRFAVGRLRVRLVRA